MILSHARLPVPTLPPERKLALDYQPEKVNQLSEKLTKKLTNSLLQEFLSSRRQGLSKHTLLFYQRCLSKAIGVELTSQGINSFLSSLACGNGKFAYFRAIRAFVNWLIRNDYIKDNPLKRVDPPKPSKQILPSLTVEQVSYLIKQVDSLRDKAIISLFADSGMRLNEIANVKTENIDWINQTIIIWGKGNKQRRAPFTQKTATLLSEWLSNNGHGNNVWDMTRRGIQSILNDYKERIGLPCNAHTFRRTFASNLHRKGLDIEHIMRLGGWGSLDMVLRYTRSVKFEDSLKLYQNLK